MTLAHRLAHVTTLVVLITAAVVGGAAVTWHLQALGRWPVGLLAVLFVAMVVALGVAHLVSRSLALPALRRVRGLAAEVGTLSQQDDLQRRLGELDLEEVAELARAINQLLDRVDGEVRRLRQEALLGRSLLEQSPTGVLVARPDGRVRYVNRAFRELVERRDRPEGRRPIETIPVAEMQQAVDAALSGRPPEELACTAGSRDLLLRPVRTDDGGALVLVQDVTRFRMAERARTDFVANVSHELRTPIASILGYAETLLADPSGLDADTFQMLKAIERNGQRLRDLFEDLLELSRIESRRQELPLARERLAPLLEQAVAPAADLAVDRGQAFSLRCDPELEALVSAEALVTIVRNLATNASNYTPEGGRVEVRAVAGEGGVVVEVEDSGYGISPAHHERIFERFYRVDEGRSRRVGGTGLGLSIVKHLALASGCRIGLRSALGQGSTFRVHLPATGEEASQVRHTLTAGPA